MLSSLQISYPGACPLNYQQMNSILKSKKLILISITILHVPLLLGLQSFWYDLLSPAHIVPVSLVSPGASVL